MSDKEKIKQEVERLKHNTPNAYDLSRFMLLEEIEDFIDSLPEESGCEVNCTTKSEDLEESARYYLLNNHVSPLNEIMHQVDLKAEMQYHKDIENAFKAGAEWYKTQMMKDAVDAWVNTYESITNPYDNQVSFITNLSPSKFRNKETVQIIIVKNE